MLVADKPTNETDQTCCKNMGTKIKLPCGSSQNEGAANLVENINQDDPSYMPASNSNKETTFTQNDFQEPQIPHIKEINEEYGYQNYQDDDEGTKFRNTSCYTTKNSFLLSIILCDIYVTSIM